MLELNEETANLLSEKQDVKEIYIIGGNHDKNYLAFW